VPESLPGRIFCQGIKQKSVSLYTSLPAETATGYYIIKEADLTCISGKANDKTFAWYIYLKKQENNL
jgi:hypothetical protein